MCFWYSYKVCPVRHRKCKIKNLKKKCLHLFVFISKWAKLEAKKINRNASDGGKSWSQFKNKFIITSLGDIIQQLGYSSIEWNFFASSHGKGTVDGVGAVIKGKVWQITKSKKVVIPDAFWFYQCAQQNINGVEIYCMPSDEIEKHSLLYNLEQKWKNVRSISGIAQLHFFCCDGQEVQASRAAYSTKKKHVL